MARNEADREDMMREAVALVRRMEFQPLSEAPPILVGFRDTGWLSIYLTPDLMYQFDEAGRLRRAFIDGLLYRTQGESLAQLRRERSDTETTLVRRDLVGDALADFRNRATEKVRWLLEQLRAENLTIACRIPADDTTLTDDLIRSLDKVLQSPVFLAPPIRGKS